MIFNDILVNSKRPSPGQKDLKGLHETFWGTTKDCENKNFTQFLFQYNFQKWTGLEGLRLHRNNLSIHPYLHLYWQYLKFYSNRFFFQIIPLEQILQTNLNIRTCETHGCQNAELRNLAFNVYSQCCSEPVTSSKLQKYMTSFGVGNARENLIRRRQVFTYIKKLRQNLNGEHVALGTFQIFFSQACMLSSVNNI